MDEKKQSDRPVERPDIFLSYNRKDRKQVEELQRALQPRFNVWIDAKIQSGRDWRDEINRKISRARCVVLYWSKNAEKSWWVAYEAFSAQNLDKLVITSFDDINAASGSWAKDLQCTRLKRPLLKHFTKTRAWEQLCEDIEHKRKRLPRLRHKGWLGGGVVHMDGVTSVSFHPHQENLLISSGRDGRAYIWNVAEATPSLKIVQTADQDDAVADATLPAADKRFELAPLDGGNRWAINRSGFSASGDAIFLACEDGIARVFRGQSFSEPVTFPHTRTAWPEYDGRRIHGLNKFSQGVVDVAMSSDGQVLTLGADQIFIWDSYEPTAPKNSYVLPPGARGRSLDCLYSKKARAFFVSDRSGRIFRVDGTGLIADALPSRSSPGAVMGHSPAMESSLDDGEWIATCSVSTSDRRIDVHHWSEGAYERVGHAQLRADYPVRALAVHPDAPVVIAAAGYRPSVVAWDDANRVDLVSEVGDHTKPIQTVAVSRSGRFVAAGGEDGCISIWQDETPRGSPNQTAR